MKKKKKILLWAMMFAGIILVLGVVVVRGQNNNQAQPTVDPRGEERTFASFPEWYIVYNAQEYGSFVSAGGRPSQFPYFGSMRQYWDSVGHAKTALGASTVDSSTTTVLRVIGASFSFENAVIGFYEKTIGRLFEALNFFVKTKEDIYTEAVAREYGEFLLHTPWYEFPYGQKLIGLWTTYGWSSLTPRGMERRIAFTIGYTIKGLYGFVLGHLSKASLGSAELETSFLTENISAHELNAISGIKIKEQRANNEILATAPRYRAFTRVIEEVAQRRGKFLSIEDHSKIMLTVIASKESECLSGLRIEFAMPMLTEQNVDRIAITSDVTDLTDLIRHLHTCSLAVEHVYDY